MSEAAPRSAFRDEQVTYALFGIDPAIFYRTRFAHGSGHGDLLGETAGRYNLDLEKIRLLIDDLKRLLPRGGRVLDVGCGAGTYGPTLKAQVPGLELWGVDMSEACVTQALGNGYARTERFDLHRPLPFAEATFDAVISMDVLGHIEFAHKDHLVAEMARVTRSTGGGHHGAETGFIDYAHCDPTDPEDPIRKYVHFDGHVGTEPEAALCARFARHFALVRPRITFLYPFVHKGALGDLFEPDFKRMLDDCDDPDTMILVNAVLGRLNRHFVDSYAKVFGPAFAAADGPAPEATPEHAAARAALSGVIEAHNARFGHDFVALPRALFRAAGFSSIFLARERATPLPAATPLAVPDPGEARQQRPGIPLREFVRRTRRNLGPLLQRWRWRIKEELRRI